MTNPRCYAIRCLLVMKHVTQIAYLLTSWSRVLLDFLTGFRLVKKFPSYYRTRRFITAIKVPASVSILSQLDPVHTPKFHWRSILILSSLLQLGLPSVSFLQVSGSKPCIRLSPPHTIINVSHTWTRCFRPGNGFSVPAAVTHFHSGFLRSDSSSRLVIGERGRSQCFRV